MVIQVHIPAFLMNQFAERFIYYRDYKPAHSVDRFLPDAYINNCILKITYMKILLSVLFFLLISSDVLSQKVNPDYDSLLARKFEADDMGMKKYILVILKTGTNNTTDKKLQDSLFAGHMANINRLVKINKLVVAGPLMKNEKTYRGIFILNVRTPEEARILLDTDPAIRENLLAADLYQWYGSAALPAYLDISDKIWKTGF
jgi:uncharacterized protein YciI